MIKLSANLGFLWTELSLPDAILAAADAGFAAVECHWPYATKSSDTLTALQTAGLPMIGLNTQRGNTDIGENGLAAVPGRQTHARQYIDEALLYAQQINCANVHVMAGFTERNHRAEQCFIDNLRYACKNAAALGITILIEPLNHFDAPEYHLSTLDEALSTWQSVGADNLKIMFDCYHLQIMQGDLTRRLKRHLSAIGHIQIASVPDRHEPDTGEVHYANLLRCVDEMGWDGYIGAEYKPTNGTAQGLSWMNSYRVNN